MGFWIFILISDMLIPLLMIGFGNIFAKAAPGKINMVYGYRTSMSMKNEDTWAFAHQYFGKQWRVWGWVLLPISVLALVFVLGRDQDTVGKVGGAICVVQMVFLLWPIVLTEKALRKEFDKEGHRRSV